jgi:RNA polymerase sporulation-specific sigma factor
MTIVLDCPSKGIGRFACAQAGCSICMESLLREHRGLIWRMVTRAGRGKAEYTDLFAEGRIGLWRAILRYEVERGVAFSSYACVVIEHQVWEAVRHSLKVEGWLEAEGREESLARVVRIWQQEQIHQALEAELQVLPERLQQVIELHYGLCGAAPQNLSEIGRGWGLCRERIRQLHEEALSLLRLPALSIHLRSICERGERSHYRQTLHQQQSRQRRLRGQR